MFNKFLYRLTASMPCRLIKKKDRPYMERYFVGQLFGWNFYLHRFVDCDGELEFHNHEWRKGFSLVLSGFYIDERVVDLSCSAWATSGCITEQKVVRWFNRVDCNTFHRVKSVASGTWTLFAHSERVKVEGRPKGWGFLYLSGDRLITFEQWPYPSTEWWHDAQLGANIGRVPL